MASSKVSLRKRGQKSHGGFASSIFFERYVRLRVSGRREMKGRGRDMYAVVRDEDGHVRMAFDQMV
jgi:hypothetical protein